MKVTCLALNFIPVSGTKVGHGVEANKMNFPEAEASVVDISYHIELYFVLLFTLVMVFRVRIMSCTVIPVSNRGIGSSTF